MKIHLTSPTSHHGYKRLPLELSQNDLSSVVFFRIRRSDLHSWLILLIHYYSTHASVPTDESYLHSLPWTSCCLASVRLLLKKNKPKKPPRVYGIAGIREATVLLAFQILSYLSKIIWDERIMSRVTEQSFDVNLLSLLLAKTFSLIRFHLPILLADTMVTLKYPFFNKFQWTRHSPGLSSVSLPTRFARSWVLSWARG